MTDLPFQVERTPNTWITLADGTRLAARIWRPVTDEPVPAILEYLPYRKGDLMAGRDEPLGTWFAGHGYAWVRVDIRGTGDSDGIITDEYTVQEHDDGLEAIAWIASQPWCTGSVGMIGISWGGFNGLQIAARRPPALKAVISMCSTDDRYADDVHYDGGCVLNWDALPWASIMFALDGLPPDPRVRDDWRETWMRRLEETPPFIEEWLSHQRRDAFWRHGSVREDYGAIEAAVYMVGGWADGYTNAIGRTLAGLPGPKKGLIGPWPHSWPHVADQGPRIDFLHEALRWWDRWLKGIDNGIDGEPVLTAWLQEPAGPRELHLDRPGRWVREDAWPPPSAVPRRLHLADDGSLGERAAAEGTRSHTGLQHHGLHAGTWCPYGPEADFPPDQREEDALCLVFDTAPLPERLELLGHPVVHLRVAADRPDAFVMARLCDVAPDGTSTLISRGSLNLTHRDSHEDVTAGRAGTDVRRRRRAGRPGAGRPRRSPGAAGDLVDVLAVALALPRGDDDHRHHRRDVLARAPRPAARRARWSRARLRSPDLGAGRADRDRARGRRLPPDRARRGERRVRAAHEPGRGQPTPARRHRDVGRGARRDGDPRGRPALGAHHLRARLRPSMGGAGRRGGDPHQEPNSPRTRARSTWRTGWKPSREASGSSSGPGNGRSPATTSSGAGSAVSR